MSEAAAGGAKGEEMKRPVARTILAAVLAQSLITVLALPATAAAPPSTAQPVPRPTIDVSDGPDAAPLTPEPDGVISAEDATVDASLPLTPNPWGCFSKTDYPHLSSHQPGTINVVGWTRGCSAPQPTLTVHVELQVRRGPYPLFWWWETIATGINGCQNCTQVKANAGTCDPGQHVYRGKTYSSMTGLDGQTYSATSYSQQATLYC